MTSQNASLGPGSPTMEIHRGGLNVKTNLPHAHYSPPQPTSASFKQMNSASPGYANGASSHNTSGFSHDNSYRQTSSYSNNHPPTPDQIHPSMQNTVGPYSMMSPANHSHGPYNQGDGTPQAASTFIPQQNVLPFNLPPAQYSHSPAMNSREHESYGGTSSADYAESSHAQATEMAMLDQMSMPGTVPIFGDGDATNKSPYVGMPEDFMAYLFNSQAADHSPAGHMMQAPYSR